MKDKDTKQTGIIKPVLYFTPYAWAKIMYLANKGDTEIGAFGFSKKDEPLTVTNVFMTKQYGSSAFIEFDKDDIGVFADKMVDEGYVPAEFGRIWIHTHPGNCPKPSGTDEEVFSDTFGRCSWSIMAIFCKDGTYYARLQYKQPRASVEMKVEIDYEAQFCGSDHDAWDVEYRTNLSQRSYVHHYPNSTGYPGYPINDTPDDLYPFHGASHRSNQSSQGVRNDGRPFPYTPLGVWQGRQNPSRGNGHMVKVVEGKRDEPRKEDAPRSIARAEKVESAGDIEVPIEVEDDMIINNPEVLEDPTTPEFKSALMAQLEAPDLTSETNDVSQTEKETKNDRSKEEVQSAGRSGQIGFTAKSAGDSDRGWSSR